MKTLLTIIDEQTARYTHVCSTPDDFLLSSDIIALTVLEEIGALEKLHRTCLDFGFAGGDSVMCVPLDRCHIHFMNQQNLDDQALVSYMNESVDAWNRRSNHSIYPLSLDQYARYDPIIWRERQKRLDYSERLIKRLAIGVYYDFPSQVVEQALSNSSILKAFDKDYVSRLNMNDFLDLRAKLLAYNITNNNRPSVFAIKKLVADAADTMNKYASLEVKQNEEYQQLIKSKVISEEENQGADVEQRELAALRAQASIAAKYSRSFQFPQHSTHNHPTVLSVLVNQRKICAQRGLAIEFASSDIIACAVLEKLGLLKQLNHKALDFSYGFEAMGSYNGNIDPALHGIFGGRAGYPEAQRCIIHYMNNTNFSDQELSQEISKEVQRHSACTLLTPAEHAFYNEAPLQWSDARKIAEFNDNVRFGIVNGVSCFISSEFINAALEECSLFRASDLGQVQRASDLELDELITKVQAYSDINNDRPSVMAVRQLATQALKVLSDEKASRMPRVFIQSDLPQVQNAQAQLSELDKKIQNLKTKRDQSDPNSHEWKAMDAIINIVCEGKNHTQSKERLEGYFLTKKTELDTNINLLQKSSMLKTVQNFFTTLAACLLTLGLYYPIKKCFGNDNNPFLFWTDGNKQSAQAAIDALKPGI